MIKNDSELNDQKKIVEATTHERTAQRGDKRYSYYLKFPEISVALGKGVEDWNHIDMLPFRHRNQIDLISDFGLDRPINTWMDGGSVVNELLEESFNIFLGIIEFLHPKVIILVNAYLSGKILELTGSPFIKLNDTNSIKSDDKVPFEIIQDSLIEKGYRVIKIMGEYPLLLSSMLTQQGALDKGSRERLVWHIKQILDVKK